MSRASKSDQTVKTEKVKTKTVTSEDIVVAVMGPTGAGKSTFISYACRNASNHHIGHNLESCTSKVQPIRIITGSHNVVLVDTPGFDDTNMSDTRVLGMIADWLLETYNNQKLSETGAGKTLYNTLQKQLDEEKRLLKELYVEAERQDNPALAADLKNQYEQVRQQLDVTFKEVESLKIPLGRRILQFFTFKKAKSNPLKVFTLGEVLMLARFSKLKERSSSTPTQGAPNPARSPHPTFRDGQALGSTPGTVLPSERPKDYPMPNANDAHPSPAPDNHHKRSRNDDLRTRGSADNPTSTQTYTIEPTSIQGEPSPKIIQHAGEIAQLDGPDTSSLQQIPDEDEFQALEVDQKLHNLHVSDHSVGHMEVDLAAHLPDTDHGTDNHVDDVEKNVPGCGNEDFTGDRGADLNASDTTSPISFQVDEKPHELLVSDPTAGHLDVAAHLPETDHITGSTGMHVGDVANNVLGCGNGDVADKDRKIAAVVDTPSDVVANGPTPHSHEVRGGIESSRISEEGLGSNPNQQDKSNISPLETGDVGDAPGSRNPLEVPSLIDSDGESMLPGEKPGATGNDGNKKGIVRFGMLRNKPKKVSTYMKKAGKIFKVKTEDLKEDDVIIAIMGPTGAGKSSFINMATGNATGVGHDLESCTNSIDILKFQCIERSMQDIIFLVEANVREKC
ncbi:hypothetical protein AB1N83_006545 [Pleurotus pulmonarius]